MARDSSGRFARGGGNPGALVSGRVVGVEAVVRRLTLMPRTVQERLRVAIRALGFSLEARVKTTTLDGGVLHRRSSDLARSVNTRFVDTETTSTAFVGTNKFYGRIWELTGLPAYTIEPKLKQALYWVGAAHPVRSVNHPAVAAKPWLRPVLESMRPEIRSTLSLAMRGL